jgi:hypothetical protein
MYAGILPQAGEQFDVRPRHAARCLLQPFPVRILADRHEYFADRALDPCLADGFMAPPVPSVPLRKRDPGWHLDQAQLGSHPRTPFGNFRQSCVETDGTAERQRCQYYVLYNKRTNVKRFQ